MGDTLNSNFAHVIYLIVIVYTLIMYIRLILFYMLTIRYYTINECQYLLIKQDILDQQK